MSKLKELRIAKKLTQQEAAKNIGISLRSYVAYENDPTKETTPKYRFLLHELNTMNRIDEDHGLLTLDEIKSLCSEVFHDLPVEFCYLFGSYAKGKAVPSSDVDLLIGTSLTGLKFYDLTETLRETLKKKVDLLTVSQLLNNEVLLTEILREGIKIYG